MQRIRQKPPDVSIGKKRKQECEKQDQKSCRSRDEREAGKKAEGKKETLSFHAFFDLRETLTRSQTDL